MVTGGILGNKNGLLTKPNPEIQSLAKCQKQINNLNTYYFLKKNHF